MVQIEIIPIGIPGLTLQVLGLTKQSDSVIKQNKKFLILFEFFNTQILQQRKR